MFGFTGFGFSENLRSISFRIACLALIAAIGSWANGLEAPTADEIARRNEEFLGGFRRLSLKSQCALLDHLEAKRKKFEALSPAQKEKFIARETREGALPPPPEDLMRRLLATVPCQDLNKDGDSASQQSR